MDILEHLRLGVRKKKIRKSLTVCAPFHKLKWLQCKTQINFKFLDSKQQNPFKY